MLRGQVRQVVKELLEEELLKAVEQAVLKSLNSKLLEIEKRQKDLAGWMIRNSSIGSGK